DPVDWAGFVGELHTAAGLVHGGRARFGRGGYDHLQRWEPALRAMFDRRPLYDPATIGLPARPQRPVAPHAPHPRDFLHAPGFALVKRVFGPDEIGALSTAADRLQASAVAGDRRSWWARDADGADVLCRITYAGLRAAEIAALEDDPRLRRLAALG